MADTAAVLLLGARQVGKSTLAQQFVASGRLARYLTLDDASLRRAALTDAQGFIASLDAPTVIDEVQRAPELFVALKLAIDQDRRPGRFLLTGSANVRLLPQVAESLAGRVELVDLWPLSQGELAGVTERFVDRLFEDERLEPGPGPDREQLAARLVRGGYPEANARPEEARRQRWFGAYLETMLQREVRDLAAIEGLYELPRVLALVAGRTAGLLNVAALARDAGLSVTTARRYLGLLEAVYLIDLVPAWSTRAVKRVARAPKAVVVDSGLACHLAEVDAAQLLADRSGLFGRLLEGFVLGELRRQCSWSRAAPTLRHFRSHGGLEVDAVLETRSGRVAGVEVKASATVSASDGVGLRRLGELVGDRFAGGVLLHLGAEAVPLGTRVHALPITTLWT